MFIFIIIEIIIIKFNFVNSTSVELKNVNIFMRA